MQSGSKSSAKRESKEVGSSRFVLKVKQGGTQGPLCRDSSPTAECGRKKQRCPNLTKE